MFYLHLQTALLLHNAQFPLGPAGIQTFEQPVLGNTESSTFALSQTASAVSCSTSQGR